MPVRKISVSLDEDVLERSAKVAEAEGVSLSTWLSRAAAEAADIAAKQLGWEEYFATYGEPSTEDMQRTFEEMKAEGHFEPESPEHFALRMAALSRLRESVPDQLDEAHTGQARRAG